MSSAEALRARQREYRRKWHLANPGRRAAADKKWRLANPGKHAASVEKWKLANPEKLRATERRSRLRRKYGISESQYENMLESQGGVCAICEVAPTTRRLAVDHEHSTGRVRELLCSQCNLVVGVVEADPLKVDRVRGYLAKHAGEVEL